MFISLFMIELHVSECVFLVVYFVVVVFFEGRRVSMSLEMLFS